MKLSNFLVGMLACATITACSNDTDAIIDTPTPNPTGNAYMAINLTMGNGIGTKATSDGGYDYGTTEEGAVKASDAFFLFYDAQGNYLTTGTIATGDGEIDEDGYLKLNDQPSDPSMGNIERTSNAVVVLGPTETKPSQVLAVLNAGSTNLLAGKNLDEAVKTIANSLTTDKGSFIMTNSVYVDNGKIVNAQAISNDNIKTSAEEAKEAPVSIYVERAAVKVSLKQGENTDFELENTSVVDGSSTEMKIVVDGWCINAYNQSTYLVKNLDASWANNAPISNWSDWSSAANHRSYWAQDANYTGEGEYENGPTYTGLTYKSYKDASKALSTSDKSTQEYCYENTVDPTYAKAQGGDYANVTTVLIAAHIETKTGDTYEQQDLFKKNGVYYTKDTWLNNIAAHCGYYWYKEGKDGAPSEWIALSEEDFEDGDYTISEESSQTTEPAKVTINFTDIKDKDGYTLVEGNTGTESKDESVVLAALNSSDYEYTKDVEGYKNGACYYQVPIEQLGPTGTTLHGVVRNHSYVLTLNSISKVGYPVYDENKQRPLIPGERTDYYVAMSLNILAWQTVEQSVEL